MKNWKKLSWAQCNNCGSSDVEVNSEDEREDWVYDSEESKCKECGCRGSTLVGEEDDALIIWDY